jgi:hypothetical protein
MRRILFLAMLPGFLLSSATLTAATHAAAKDSFARASHRDVDARRPQTTEARSLSRSRAALAHARRRPTSLPTVQPAATALIDPVPRGRFVLPPPLKGSHDSLVRQNVRSNEEGLERIQDDADLLDLRRQKQLVPLPVTPAMAVDERLPANRRYCRPWTAQFLSDLSRIHYGRFHRSLQVNSAVRTVEYQRHLELVNGNAAPAEGEDASPHLTGATVDIAKKGLSMGEVGWIRAYLMPLQAAGKIDVEEEFYQSCFHITVYRSYSPAAGSQERSHPGGSASLLAARMR